MFLQLCSSTEQQNLIEVTLCQFLDLSLWIFSFGTLLSHVRNPREMSYADVQANSLGRVLANINLRHVNEEMTLGTATI